MKILFTGATGYIGARLLIRLAEAGHQVIALVCSVKRVAIPKHLSSHIQLIEGDLLDSKSLEQIPQDIEAAYYLVHSMKGQSSKFSDPERVCATNFREAVERTQAKQVIYLSGLSQGEALSEHMASRREIERILSEGKVPLTVLRAGIIVGAGSASFEIMRDLVEKLPVMVAPKWVFCLCQPIAIVDVLFYLENALEKEECLGRVFEIGGPDVFTYREMLLRFAKLRGLKRFIVPVPVLTPYLSGLWLFLVTSVNFPLSMALVNSLKNNAICTDRSIDRVLPHNCLNFDDSIERAFERIEQHAVISSWKDAMVQSELQADLTKYIAVPRHGCFKRVYKKTYSTPKSVVLDRLWRIGGDTGWYAMDWAWALRGAIDKNLGGVGMRRGRTHPEDLKMGDVLDFWRVLAADREDGCLLLYAEMRLPGEAWLEWKVSGGESETTIEQIATFRPKGLMGRLYWYSLAFVHYLLFPRMCNSIGKKK